MFMDRTPRPDGIKALLVLPSVLVLILYLPLPFPLKLCGLVAAPVWLLGVRRGGQTLLIASPLFVAWISLAYLPVSQRAVGAFVIAYIVGLFMVGVAGFGKDLISVWRFLMETRALLRDVHSGAGPSQPLPGPESPIQKRPWAERLARRILGVS